MVLDRIQITEKHSSLNNTFTASHVGRVTPISPSVGTRGSAGSDLSPCHNGPVCPLVVLLFLLFKSTEIRENKKKIDVVLKINRQQRSLILYALKHRLDHCL